MTLFYIIVGVIFGCGVWYFLGSISGKEYFAGFLLAKSMAYENVFVISMVFQYLKIPREYQYKVLF